MAPFVIDTEAERYIILSRAASDRRLDCQATLDRQWRQFNCSSESFYEWNMANIPQFVLSPYTMRSSELVWNNKTGSGTWNRIEYFTVYLPICDHLFHLFPRQEVWKIQAGAHHLNQHREFGFIFWRLTFSGWEDIFPVGVRKAEHVRHHLAPMVHTGLVVQIDVISWAPEYIDITWAPEYNIRPGWC